MKQKIKKFLNNTIFLYISRIKLMLFCKKYKKIIWLLGTAHYNNIGDLAISLATKQFLKDNFNSYTIFEVRLSDYDIYKKALCKYIKKADIIILQGGGNLGINYFTAEFNRREIMTQFSNNPIILFPSTIDYGDSSDGQKELCNSEKIYNNCSRLTLIAREEKTYYKFKEIYKCHIILQPDIVFYLKYDKLQKRNNKIGLCLRDDLENNTESIDYSNILERYECDYFDNICKKKNIAIHERKRIVYNKLDEISKYSLVITDRLHTMIFCYLTKTPCIAINNSNGKIKGVYEKWLKECNYIYLYKKYDKIELLTKSFINMKCDYKKNIHDFDEIKRIILKEIEKNEEVY